MNRLSHLMRAAWKTATGRQGAGRRRRTRRPTRPLLFEVCEPRLALSTVSFGTISASNPALHRGGAITSTNTSDEYQFALATPAAIRANLSGLSADLNLSLRDSAGTLIRSSNLAGNSIENFSTTTLAAGNYSLRVVPLGNVISNYEVTVSQNYSSDDLVSNAVNIGALSASVPTIMRTNSVNSSSDFQDYFRVTVDAGTTVRVNLSSLSANLDVQILDSLGRVVSGGSATDSTFENIATPSLAAGTYIVRVLSVGVGNSLYWLTISQNGSSDDLLSGAIDLSTLTATKPTVRMSQDVGTTDDIQDYFRFAVDSTTNVQLNLSGMFSNLNIDLLDSFGRVLRSGTSTGTAIESFARSLTPGTYFLRVFPGAAVTSAYDLTISRSSSSDDYLTRATELGGIAALTPTRHAANSIDFNSDIQDYYRFTLDTAVPVRVNLFGMSANVNFELLDVTGRIVTEGTNSGTAIENMLTQLGGGTYFVRVFPAEGAASSYSLTVNRVGVSDDILTGATDLGSITSARPTVNASGNVGGTADIHDFYRFTTDTVSPLRINLSGLSADTNVQLLDDLGRNLFLGNVTSNAIENFVRVSASVGTYYLRVFGATIANSPYLLTVSRDVNSDDLISNAISLGTLDTIRPTARASGTAGVAAGVTPDIQDYHKFTLTAASDVRLNLSGLSADLNFQLLNAVGQSILVSSNPGNNIENLLAAGLAAGNYFVVVQGIGASKYELAVSTATASDDLLTNATSLGSLAPATPTARVFGTAGGADDIQDFYKFTLSAVSGVRLNVSALTADLDVQLLDVAGQLIASSRNASPLIENVLVTSRAAGTYFVRIVAFSGTTTTSNYDLVVSISTSSDDLITQATNLGTLTNTSRPTVRMAGAVGGAADIHDYHKFTLSTASDVRINLSGMSADLDMQLQDLHGRTVAFAGSVGNVVENLLITALAAGTYYIRIFPVAGATSTNYDLVASVSTAGVDDLLSTANGLGTLTSPTLPTIRTFSVVGGAADIQDYYSFTLGAASAVRLNLSAMSADLNVELLDAAGRVIAAGSLPTKAIENILATGPLAAGTYFVRVFPASTVQSEYDLTVSVATTSDDLLSTPNSVGLLTSPTRPTAYFTGSTGGAADIQDYYRFAFSATSDVRLSLSGLTSDLDVQLLDVYGRIIASGANGGFGIEDVLAPELVAGTYYIRVFAFIGASSYDLTVSVSSSDDLITSANGLGSLDSATNPTIRNAGSVGGTADIQDYHHFSLSAASDVRLILSGMSANLQVTLLDEDGRLLHSGLSPVLENVLVTGLAAGNYFIRVFPSSATLSSDYDLVLSTDINSEELITNARSLGVLNSVTMPTVRISGRVGDLPNTRDYYSFTLNTANNVRLNLSGLSQDLDVSLLNSSGGTIASGTFGGTSIESVFGSGLAAGTYYILVYPFSGSSSYDLTVSTKTLDDDLLTNAFDLATLDYATRPSTFVTSRTGGPANIQDYYRFTLNAVNDLRLNLSGLTNDLDVQLLDGDGRVIGSSLSSATTVENYLAVGLAVGTYYVRVFDASRESPSNYDLGLSVVTFDDDLIQNAMPLGTLNTTTQTAVSRTGAAGGPADSQDYHIFNLNDGSEVRVDLSGLSTDLDWQLLDDEGRVIAESTGINNSVQNMVVTGLVNGAYRVRVFGFSGQSDYELRVSTLTDNDNDLTNATDMTPTLPLQPRVPVRRRSGTVGAATDLQDFYYFDLALATTVRLNLSGLGAADLDVELLNSAGTMIAHGIQSGNSIESVLATGLAQGGYYVRVYAFSGASDYDLTVGVDTESNRFISHATDLGALNAATRNTAFGSKEYTENGDQAYFKVTLDNPSDLRLNVSGLTNNVQLQLLDANGRLITTANSNFGSGTSLIKDLLVSGLAAGTYYAYVSGSSSSYDLTVSVATSSPNLIINAFDARSVPKTLAGTIASKDLQRYAKFTVTESRQYHITLYRLTDSLDIELLDAHGRRLAGSSFTGEFDREISASLSAGTGTYYVRIFASEPGDSSNFEVRIE